MLLILPFICTDYLTYTVCLSSAATSSFPRLSRLTALTLGEGEFTCSPGLFCDLWDETLMALLQ